VSRKDDLEQSIRESEDLINQYQAVIRESSDPKEKARARREIAEQRGLIEEYQAELDVLALDTKPGEVADPQTAAWLATGSRQLKRWLIGAVIALAVLGSTVLGARWAIPPSPSSRNDIVNQWQWTELRVKNDGIIIADPENYVLVLNPDGGPIYIQTDCNTGFYVYELDEDHIDLARGPITPGTCGSGSLSGSLLVMLDRADTIELDNGKLVLMLPEDTGRIVFERAGIAEIAPQSVESRR